jgi:hypothetical protein
MSPYPQRRSNARMRSIKSEYSPNAGATACPGALFYT